VKAMVLVRSISRRIIFLVAGSYNTPCPCGISIYMNDCTSQYFETIDGMLI